MNTKHFFLATALLLSALATGCASLDVEGNGQGASDNSILAQLENDSRGK